LKNYNLNTTITACDLEEILKAGTNITITKLDDCTLEISSTGGGGSSNGIKYHFKDGESITIEECIQYNLYYNLILDINSIFTIDLGGQLVVHNGFINNNGQLVNNGQIFNT
jgi:hypothetical protein